MRTTASRWVSDGRANDTNTRYRHLCLRVISGTDCADGTGGGLIMFYLYIPCDDGSPLFLKSEVAGHKNLTVDCMDGTVVYLDAEEAYEESWHESPLHATMFNDGGAAVCHACNHHPTISSAVYVMSDIEARQYL